MKGFVIISVLALFCSSAFAFWWPCDGGHRVPDRVESPHCDEHRCNAVRGQTLTARVYITSDQSHAELMVFPTVFIGGIGKLINF